MGHPYVIDQQHAMQSDRNSRGIGKVVTFKHRPIWMILHISQHWPRMFYCIVHEIHPQSLLAYAPGITGTFSSPLRISDPDRHNNTCVTHAPWCMPGSLTSVFLWSRWRGKCSRHSRCMCNPWLYVSGKWHMGCLIRIFLKKAVVL